MNKQKVAPSILPLNATAEHGKTPDSGFGEM